MGVTWLAQVTSPNTGQGKGHYEGEACEAEGPA